MAETLRPRMPTIVDMGIYARHDQSCAVMHGKPAVLDLGSYVFQPCWTAQSEGWRLVQANNWFQRLALRFIFGVSPP